jgi:hypothetical protein
MKRRNVIKGLAMLPVAGAVLPAHSVLGNSTSGSANNSLVRPETTEASFMADTNIFRSIGVEPVINCMGTLYNMMSWLMELASVWLTLLAPNGVWFRQVVQPGSNTLQRHALPEVILRN